MCVAVFWALSLVASAEAAAPLGALFDLVDLGEAPEADVAIALPFWEASYPSRIFFAVLMNLRIISSQTLCFGFQL